MCMGWLLIYFKKQHLHSSKAPSEQKNHLSGKSISVCWSKRLSADLELHSDKWMSVYRYGSPFTRLNFLWLQTKVYGVI